MFMASAPSDVPEPQMAVLPQTAAQPCALPDPQTAALPHTAELPQTAFCPSTNTVDPQTAVLPHTAALPQIAVAFQSALFVLTIRAVFAAVSNTAVGDAAVVPGSTTWMSFSAAARSR